MILSYKGYKICENQRKALELCRATPLGKIANPKLCEKQSVNLLECFNTLYF
jgi:hypothetical protein